MYLKPLLLILLGTMAGTYKLKKPFTLEGIAFRWLQHPLPEYEYFDKMMNLKYAQITIETDELVGSKTYTGNTLLTIYYDAVDLIKEAYITHVMDKCSADQNDCKTKMKSVPFMTVHRSAGYFHMTKPHHFGQALYAYTGTNPHSCIENTEYFIIYLDSSTLFPTLDENIDCSDFGKIFLMKPQPKHQLTTGLSTTVTQGGETETTTNTGGKTDLARLTYILEKQYQYSHNIKEENLGKCDATTQTGIPQEVIT